METPKTEGRVIIDRTERETILVEIPSEDGSPPAVWVEVSVNRIQGKRVSLSVRAPLFMEINRGKSAPRAPS